MDKEIPLLLLLTDGSVVTNNWKAPISQKNSQEIEGNSDLFELSSILTKITLIKFEFLDVPPSIVTFSSMAISWAAFGNSETLVIKKCLFNP
jgi:hypothetical protein